MASTTACAAISPPSANCTTRAGPRASRPMTSRVVSTSAPNFTRLPAGPVGELRAGDAVGEAEVVLDPAALAGLAAGRRAARPARCAGPRTRRRPRRPARPGRRRRRPGRRSRRTGWWSARRAPASSALGRLRQRGAVGGDHHRHVGRRRRRPRVEQALALRLVRGVPAVGHRGCGPGSRGPRTTAPTSGARRPWSRSTGGRRSSLPGRRSARRRPGRASPPAGPTA